MNQSEITAHPSKTKAWVEAMRLRTLPVSVAGVIAGTACAIIAGGFAWLPCMICMLFAVVAQIVSNFANEYYDFKNGFDAKGREGFRRGVTEGDLKPADMKRATFTLLFLDCLLGCSLIFWGGWWLVPVGIAIAIFAMAYSTGPYPLSHHGLGDIAVVIFFGIVPVMFTCYVQTGSMEMWRQTLLTGIAIGMLADNVLIVNNYRDMEADASVGKLTTVVLFGRKVMSGVYLIFFVAGIVMLFFAVPAASRIPSLIAWIPMLCLYTTVWHKICTSRGSMLNKCLRSTAILMLCSSLLFLLSSLL